MEDCNLYCKNLYCKNFSDLQNSDKIPVMDSNLIIQPFDTKNIPLILDVVVPLWSPPVGTDEFKRFNVEYIVRRNFFENQYNFELVDSDGNFLSSAFFARKNDFSNAQKWFAKNSVRFPDDYKVASKKSNDFCEMMDVRTLSFMNDDDIKLSLFISRKHGAGIILLDELIARLGAQGWKNLYLWTDCECNWLWYKKHGFTLVEESVYEPFSTEEDYKTFIFKRKI